MTPETVTGLFSVLVALIVGWFGYRTYHNAREKAKRPSPIEESAQVLDMQERIAKNLEAANDDLRLELAEARAEIKVLQQGARDRDIRIQQLEDELRLAQRDLELLGGEVKHLNGK